MANIKNIEDLRKHALETLNKLESKKIDIAEAGITAKLYESVISSAKTEMEYHRLMDQKARIAFLEGASVMHDITPKRKQLPHTKKEK